MTFDEVSAIISYLFCFDLKITLCTLACMFQKIPKVLYIITQENPIVKLNHPKKGQIIKKGNYTAQL